MQDLYADNALSGARIQEVFDDAHDAGVAGLADLRSNPSSSSVVGNANRRLRTFFFFEKFTMA